MSKKQIEMQAVFGPGLRPKKSDAVNSPAHYNQGRIEVIAAIEDWNLDFHLGNVVKYVARAGVKSSATELQDLEKARWYLDRKIKKLKGE